MAEISVIVPVYNAEKYLPRCLRSIQEQTIFDQMEVILVNDGSTDASGRICDEFAAQHANVRVLHKGNGGVSSARNAGLDAATGAFIGFVDSDDFIRRDAMEIARDFLRGGAEGVFFRTAYVYDDEEVRAPAPPAALQLEGADVYRALFLHRYGVGTGVPKVYRADVIGKERFPEGVCIGEDSLFLFRVLLKLRRAVVPAPVLYFARKPPKGTKPDKIYPEKQRFAVYEEMERLSVQAYPELLPLAQADKMNARRHILLGMLVVPELIDTSYYRELLRAHRREIVALLKNPEREVLTPKIKAHALLLCISPWLAKLWCKRRAIKR